MRRTGGQNWLRNVADRADLFLAVLNLAFCRHRVGTRVQVKTADRSCLKPTRRGLSVLEGYSVFLSHLISQKLLRGAQAYWIHKSQPTGEQVTVDKQSPNQKIHYVVI